MPHFSRRWLWMTLIVASLWTFPSLPLVDASDGFRDPLGGPGSVGRRGGSTQAPLLKVTLKGQDVAGSEKSERLLTLAISLSVPEGGYTYSMRPGFPGATRVLLPKLTAVEPADESFAANREPHSEFSAEFNETVEKYKDGEVTWSRRFRLTPGAKPEDVRIVGRVKYQICNSLNCTPHDETFEATLSSPARVLLTTQAAALLAAEPTKPAAQAAPLKIEAATESPQNSQTPMPNSANQATSLEQKPFETTVVPQRGKIADPVKLRFRLAPENAKPGEPVVLSVTMQLEPEWHTFALDQDPKNAGLPTLLEVASTQGLSQTDEPFSPSLVPETKMLDGGKEQRLHHTEITWSRQFTVEKAEYGVSGQAVYQICRDGQCRPPKKVPFALGRVAVATSPSPAKVETPTVEPQATPNGQQTAESPAEAIADDMELPLDQLLPSFKGQRFEPVEEETAGGLAVYLVYAFLGGLILNVMPCVLPVIAIKVLSFVKQAGESRHRILTLNVMYSLGVLLVFLALATLAVFAKLGWGNLFQQTEFQVAMSVLVFAMGLSLMGVFEIPLPGMVGSAASHQQQEGMLGAFFTGVFATLLATPCSGPFLGVTLGWSVQQPAPITYLVWAVMGVGMASPYVVLGFFPAWVKFLPKPGNWMVTFKQVCGWILMGTVLFLMSSLKANWIMPLLILLLAVGFSLWAIGNLYHINSPAGRKWMIRAFATAASVLGWWFASDLANPNVKKLATHELPWKAFAGVTVDEQLKQGRTVLIDFTADWCLSCKTNEKLALNTPETLQIVKQHKVATLKADWTDGQPEITRWLKAFDSVSVPLTVIFPGGDPTRPIVIRDLYSKTTLLDKLGQAVEVKSVLGQDVSQR